MKKGLIILVASCMIFRVYAQEQELQQLVLNIQKLAQLRTILTNMYKGYEIVSGGYNTVKDVTEGNFSLHKTFLDGLMAVSPVVRNYKRVGDVFSCQVMILQEYKVSLNRFKADPNIKTSELEYITLVYSNLLDQSAKNLEQLAIVITANKLRMSDDERLRSIDRIADDMDDKLSFLRYFNSNTTMLAIQRARERKEIETVQKIYGVDK